MTVFVGVKDVLSWLGVAGPERAISGMIEYLEHDFRRWPSFDRVPRVASHTPLGVIELMPTADDETYSFKYVNGHPSNPGRGLQTVTAFGVLADVASGYPTFMAEMTVLTALRTAATSAVAAKLLARPGAQTMALVGAGSQCEFQALAFRSALGISTIRLFDIDHGAVVKALRNLETLGFGVEVCSSAASAARGADVITTCTADKANRRVLHREDVAPGTHVNAIGGDCPGKTELDPALLDDGSVFVEHTPQTRVEGEIQNRPHDFPVTELWQVLTGRAPGRTSLDEITVFDSVGFAIEDFSALRYLRDAVVGTPWYQHVDLVAEPDDPKDLFGMVGSLAPVG